jgi:glycosyltransferase involved in cell wall biosynthesis
MLAESCNPEWHSLPALVYNYYAAIRRYCDVTLVTQVRNQPDIEEVGPAGAEIVYLDTERIASPLHKAGSFLSGDSNKAMTLKVAFSYPSYLYFERLAWKYFGGRLTAGQFDLVHRVSPMSPTVPSPIASWSPIPFVIGPLLGGLAWPPQYANEMRREREWMNYVRRVHRYIPFYQSTYAKAAAILAAYQHTISDLPASSEARIIEFSEGGIHPADFPKPNKQDKERMTVLFVGRLVPFKLPEVLVRSFVQSPLLRQHRLVIVGDGPELPRLEKLITEQGLQECVELRGTISYSEVVALMRESEIFGFPSIREQGGGVLTMASMCEMACVVVEYGGPAVRVPPDCGIRVPMGDIPELVEGFTEAFEKLLRNPERVREFGRAAREFTERHYAWDSKAQKTLEIYRWVLGQTAEKPNFWEPPKLPAEALQA